MFPSYEIIEAYQRLVKNAINQNLFCCQIWSMNQLNMKQLSGKAKIKVLGDIFQTNQNKDIIRGSWSKQVVSGREHWQIFWRVKIPGIFEEQNRIPIWTF